MDLLVLPRLHVLHPDLIKEDFLFASQDLDLIPDNQIEIRSDLLDQLIGLHVLQDLLVALHELIDVRLTQLHHVLLAKLELEGNDLEDQGLQLVPHHTNYILFSVDNLSCLSKKAEVLEVVMSTEPRGSKVHSEVEGHEIVKKTGTVLDLGLDLLEQVGNSVLVLCDDFDNNLEDVLRVLLRQLLGAKEPEL
eukprot:CAMPEP_0170509946 /NCGR_PEP_ID=MMETSP0208-20121228/65493_1 /TAXON_ID=197538 /ORGANISM="Strombidium inclinatum, Strain S3" /LENGTH=191 /DNA_ID=CAMNT_0010793357 /DNA_START=4371 /DNA_END=4946 /DNA_ORIENTATION=-